MIILKNFQQSPPVPYWSIAKSLPFYAILFAHMGQNYGYETLMTELPTYMKQVLRFSLKEVRILFFVIINIAFYILKFIIYVHIRSNVMIYNFKFSICLQNGILSALPYAAMWLFSMFISVVTDWMIYSDRFTHTSARKIINSLGNYP